jgi:hypothetical protein
VRTPFSILVGQGRYAPISPRRILGGALSRFFRRNLGGIFSRFNCSLSSDSCDRVLGAKTYAFCALNGEFG